MKVDPHLTVVKRLEAVDGGRQRQLRPSSEKTQDSVVLLVSQENRRACRLSPTSLGEAKDLLERVQGSLGNTREETLTEVHQLDCRCLVRLGR
jgi:hypothetical protein